MAAGRTASRSAAALVVLGLAAAACTSSEPAPTTAPPPSTTTPAPATAPPPTSTVAEPAALPVALAPAPIPNETYYAPFPVAITLDGDVSDWEGVPTVVMPPDAGSLPGITSVEFAAAADAEFLYLLADVTDPIIVTGEHGADFWNEDSVEFYVNGTGNLNLYSYTDGVAQLTVPPLNAGRAPGEVVFGGIQADSAEATAAVVETAAGYAVEVAVPLDNAVWTMRRAHGDTIGFQVHLNGASDFSRDLKLIWSKLDTGDTSYQDPSVFGRLTFFEIGQTELPALAQEEDEEAVEPVPDDAPYKQAELAIADRVDDLLLRMTLAEKIGQMTLVEKNSILGEDIARFGIGALLSGGGGSPDDNTPAGWAEMVDGFQDDALGSRLGIPLLYGVDAVHGHNNVPGAVIFPHNVGLGAANDPELMERIGRVTAREMIATGIYWNYAPAVSVPQDIRWGRTYEGYSEDPVVVSNLAAAYIRGLQGDDLADPETVLATPKHFVGDGGTAWGSSTTGSYQIDQGDTDADEATLRAVHLPPYLAAIDEGAQSVMVSYSSWGGEKMHAQQYLLTDVLRDELAFPGFVLSDWGAIDQIDQDYYQAVVAAINAGIDMNMVPHNYRRFIFSLLDAVEAGEVPEERVDDAVRSILTVKFALGLFERPHSNPGLLAAVGSDEHRAVAQEAVAKSQVLLKNDGGLLPLDPSTGTVLVGGEAADDIGIQSGGWTIEWQGAAGDITDGTTILEAIRATVSLETAVLFDEFGRFEVPAGSEPAVCIGVVGELPYAEGVGDDENLRLPATDLRMLDRMREQCDRLGVILISGRPLIVTDLIDEWDALMAAWLPGTEGQGIADVLFGLESFTGRLPYTWPRSVDQLPAAATADPLFPLGFGLSGG